MTDDCGRIFNDVVEAYFKILAMKLSCEGRQRLTLVNTAATSYRTETKVHNMNFELTQTCIAKKLHFT